MFFICLSNAYCIELADFNITAGEKHFSVESSESEIINLFKDENPIIEDEYHKESGYVSYKYNGIEFCFVNNTIFSMILDSNEFVLKSGISVGSNIKKVYEQYSEIYAGKFADGYDFIDLYCRLPTDSHWKEPQYTLRFIYKDKKITKISIFYSE